MLCNSLLYLLLAEISRNTQSAGRMTSVIGSKVSYLGIQQQHEVKHKA
jgi:hypothetical protein